MTNITIHKYLDKEDITEENDDEMLLFLYHKTKFFRSKYNFYKFHYKNSLHFGKFKKGYTLSVRYDKINNVVTDIFMGFDNEYLSVDLIKKMNETQIFK